MGYVTCRGQVGNYHRERRACWRCDACPTCKPEIGRLTKGDYCRDCVRAMKAQGLVWSEYFGNYVGQALAVKAAMPGFNPFSEEGGRAALRASFGTLGKEKESVEHGTEKQS